LRTRPLRAALFPERKELGVRLQELKTRKKALQETNTSRRKLILALATELKVGCAVTCAFVCCMHA
jgi:hypothetical protein